MISIPYPRKTTSAIYRYFGYVWVVLAGFNFKVKFMYQFWIIFKLKIAIIGLALTYLTSEIHGKKKTKVHLKTRIQVLYNDDPIFKSCYLNRNKRNNYVEFKILYKT